MLTLCEIFPVIIDFFFYSIPFGIGLIPFFFLSFPFIFLHSSYSLFVCVSVINLIFVFGKQTVDRNRNKKVNKKKYPSIAFYSSLNENLLKMNLAQRRPIIVVFLWNDFYASWNSFFFLFPSLSFTISQIMIHNAFVKAQHKTKAKREIKREKKMKM